MNRDDAAKPFWHSLDDRADTPEFRAFAAQEFPGFANVFEALGEAEVEEGSALSRRSFLALSAAGLGLAGLAGCRRPDLQVLPYSKVPDNTTPGLPTFYATALPRPGGAFPVVVETSDGRPTKVEGNPGDPVNKGSTDVYAQASILDLYSPDRSREVMKRDENGAPAATTWADFDAFAAGHFAGLKKKQGEGLAFLLEDHPSPAMRLLRTQMEKDFPKATWHAFEPIATDAALAAGRMAFDKPLLPRYRFDRATRVVALDADFLGADADQVANARAFALKRAMPDDGEHAHDHGDHKEPKKGDHKEGGHDDPGHAGTLANDRSRLYVVETAFTVTGTMADHRLRLPAAAIGDYAVALAKAVAAKTGAAGASFADAKASTTLVPDAWIDAVADDLLAFKGKSLVLAGVRQPAFVHAVCHFINDALGNGGKTVEYRSVPTAANGTLAELADKLKTEAGLDTLVVVGGNPAFAAPAELKFAELKARAKTLIRVGLFADETSDGAAWHLPLAHPFESWGDAETADGLYAPIQPLIAPLHGGRSLLELLVLWTGYEGTASYDAAKTKVYDLVRASFKAATGKDDELSFKKCLHVGLWADPIRKGEGDGVKFAGGKLADAAKARTPYAGGDGYEVSFHPAYGLYDGRYATNAWLMEFPDPITKIVWDNAAVVSPATAKKLGIPVPAFGEARTGNDKRYSFLEIEVEGRKLEIPAFVLPGQADDSISIALGYGKLRVGNIPKDCGGFNAYALRTAANPWFARASVQKLDKTYDLVTTQEHGAIPEKRDEIVKTYSFGRYEELVHPHDHAGGHHEEDPRKRYQYGYKVAADEGAGRTKLDLAYPETLDSHHQWGMVIDLNVCTGCSACVVACQSENNIPVVGKNEVKRNREMYWILLHRYFSTAVEVGAGEKGQGEFTTDDPAVVTQPMLCQHCEDAPCENVCPVNAAVHSPEGLNHLAYNRCIGTRYCANNCPYKVRRFNWLNFNERQARRLAGADLPRPGELRRRHRPGQPVAEGDARDAEDAVEPRRHRPHARRHGEVHLLPCSGSSGPRSGRRWPPRRPATTASRRRGRPTRRRPATTSARSAASARSSCRTAPSRRPAGRPARPRPSSSATSTTRPAKSTGSRTAGRPSSSCWGRGTPSRAPATCRGCGT